MARSQIAAAVMLACASCDAAGPGKPNAAELRVPDDAEGPRSTVDEPELAARPENANEPASEEPDPRSAAAAAAVLEAYWKMLEEDRFAEARRLWSGGGPGGDAVADRLRRMREFRAATGVPGPVEGAAGSLYVAIPIRLSGRREDGSSFAASGSATLRRANDVPGSTPEQRQWRIYRIDVQPPL